MHSRSLDTIKSNSCLVDSIASQAGTPALFSCTVFISLSTRLHLLHMHILADPSNVQINQCQIVNVTRQAIFGHRAV